MELKYSLILASAWLFVLAAVFYAFVYPKLRRKRLDNTPFPDTWLAFLRRNLSVYASMRPELQEQLQGLIIRFMADKQFMGCAGQQINDEIRVTIAAHACLLLLNRPSHEYSALKSILVYPAAFRVKRDTLSDGGLVSENHHTLSGESWSTGKIVLSWDDVNRGISSFSDGHNVVLHEFAHQLDQESGSTNGAPLLYSREAYEHWGKVLNSEFKQLRKASANHHDSLIDVYGATNPAEFFAVVTETFFEQPRQLEQQHEELFNEFLNYYQVDPREWHET
ncbi:MAG: zinc-dependent peptidase [Pseudohongiellaceae bacterium]|nr:zinc-dependent peptidase [Pseudohongiellaceae bacterium]